jgi:hypothetical protein
VRCASCRTVCDDGHRASVAPAGEARSKRVGMPVTEVGVESPGRLVPARDLAGLPPGVRLEARRSLEPEARPDGVNLVGVGIS